MINYTWLSVQYQPPIFVFTSIFAEYISEQADSTLTFVHGKTSKWYSVKGSRFVKLNWNKKEEMITHITMNTMNIPQIVPKHSKWKATSNNILLICIRYKPNVPSHSTIQCLPCIPQCIPNIINDSRFLHLI